ncbi:putative Methyltransferase domain-containing protein 2 [Homarus americanus]|uniref:Putative Methyltransferase domain-containing protein 2 n=1 Tax=Homarus americanus TaxID=6706 RepID=A0A8J5JII0_HOMAM|nr:putative Methyltransferase domain-containing protein 2 [Homarus americanus]
MCWKFDTMAEYILGRSTKRTAKLWVTGACLTLVLVSFLGTHRPPYPATQYSSFWTSSIHLVNGRYPGRYLPFLVFPALEEKLMGGNILAEALSVKVLLMSVTPHHSFNTSQELITYLHRSPPQSKLQLKQKVDNKKLWGPKLETVSDYFRYLKTPQNLCRKLVRLGGTISCKKGTGDENNMDGHKYVCMDPSLEVVGARDARQCLTLSFGTQRDTSFDDAASELPCEVHMFDVLNFDPLLPKESDHVFFHVVDIEQDEWESFINIAKDPLFDAVGQVALEVHVVDLVHGPNKNSPPDIPREKWLEALQKRYDILRMIEARGFQRVLYWDNTQEKFSLYDENGTRHETAGEVLYINTNWYNTTFKQDLARQGYKFRGVT